MPGRRRAVLAVALSTLSAAAVVSFGVPASDASRSNRAIAVASVDNAGAEGAGGVAGDSQLSGNGRYLAFTSADPLAGPATLGHTNIFVRDLRDKRTVQISLEGTLGADGPKTTPSKPDGNTPDGDSFLPSISADGRFVSFLTSATNIVPLGYPATKPGTTVVVCDRDPSGASDINFDLVMDSDQAGTSIPDYVCFDAASSLDDASVALVKTDRPRLSGDGTHIVWTQKGYGETTYHQNVVARLTASPNRPLRAPDQAAVVPNTVVGFEQGNQGGAALSFNGKVVTYVCNATFVQVIGFLSNDSTAIIRTDLADSTSVRVDVDPRPPTDPAVPVNYLGDELGEAVNASVPSMSDAGDEIAFTAQGSITRVVVAKISTVAVVTTRFVSLNNTGVPDVGQFPTLSGDGRYVVYQTSAQNMYDGVFVSDAPQLVARDLRRDEARLASLLQPLPGALVSSSDGAACNPTGDLECASNNSALSSSLDTDGDKVAFDSSASDIVGGDGNGKPDAFVRTWQPTVNLTPSPLDFGAVRVGAGTEKNVTATVSGFGPVRLGNGRTVTGPGYRLGNDNCPGVVLHDSDGANVPANPKSCAYAVDFRPTIGGTDVGKFSIQLPGQTTDLASVNLTAVGTRKDPTPLANGTTVRTSVSGPAPGTQVNADSNESMVSGNGRWDVFASAGNLDNRGPGPGSGAGTRTNIFVRDLADPQKVVQISLAAAVGANANAAVRPATTPSAPRGTSPNDSSYRPNISADGRFVTFMTDATDVVPFRPSAEFAQDAGSSSIAVCDRDPTGARNVQGDLVLDAPRPGTRVPNYVCYAVDSGASGTDAARLDSQARPRLSADGTRITWTRDKPRGGDFIGSRAMVATLSTRGGRLQAPARYNYVPSTILGLYDPAAVDDPNVETASQYTPALTADGNHVVFGSSFGCCNAQITGIVVTDLGSATADPSSVRLDTVANGSGYLGDNHNGFVSEPAMSDTGGRIAFTYNDGTDYRVYVVNRTPATSTVSASSIVSLNNDGGPGNGFEPALSGDGRYVAFTTDALNMHNGVDNDTGNCSSDGQSPTSCEVLVRDLNQDAARAAATLPRLPNELVSASLKPDCQPVVPVGVTCAGRGNSGNPSLDGIGSEIGFDSGANDLVVGDTNQTDNNGLKTDSQDAFVRTWRPTLTAPNVDFGTVKVGAASARILTLSLTGFGPAAIGQILFTGANAGQFTVLTTSCNGVVLHDTGTKTCSLNVRFRPTAAGVRTATASVYTARNSYPRADPLVMIGLRGVGKKVVVNPTPADFTAGPNPLLFGSSLPLKTPGVSRTITLVNTGGSTLAPPTFIVRDGAAPGSHGDFAVAPGICASPLPAGGTCVVTITFVGRAAGDRTAVLVITGVAVHPITTITLSASVPAPQIFVNPAVTPVNRVVMVRGAGFAPNRAITIGTAENRTIMTVKTDASGVFRRGMVVLSGVGVGPLHVIGVVTGVVPTISAQAPLLIVLGTLESPKLVFRH